jgi:hypothetical protein
MPIRTAAVVLASLAGLTAVAGLTVPPKARAQADAITVYSADYEVRYKGRHVANATFAVRSLAPGEYQFDSSTAARGLLRLASPNAALETSRFDIAAGKLRPQHFSYEDGSRKGEDNFTIDFDASNDVIRVMGPQVSLTLPFEPDLLDRGSLQVALMHTLNQCIAPQQLRYVDDDGVATYRYSRLEDLAADTGIGDVPTVRFAQQSEGSSRRTIIWLAPEYGFVPVRIEQERNGEVETVFTLESVSGVAKSAPPCSSFR